MPGFANYLRGKLLDHTFGNTAYTAPATVYAGLYTTAPADNNTGGVEVTGGSYARVSITNNTTNFPNATLGVPTTKSNGTAITFTQASASWGTIVAMGFFDASSSGNLLGWSPLVGTSYAYTALASTSIFTAPGYSPANGDTIILLPDLGGTTPGGFTLNTQLYYVVSSSGNTFKLSLTLGGGAVTVSSDGSGRAAITTQKSIGTNDTATFPTNSVVISLE